MINLLVVIEEEICVYTKVWEIEKHVELEEIWWMNHSYIVSYEDIPLYIVGFQHSLLFHDFKEFKKLICKS